MSVPITVVIVSYNSGPALVTCVARLREQSLEHDILIVDNASSDGAPRSAFDAFSDLHILPLRRNVGFARAVNIALGRLDEDAIVVLLNPDTEAHPDFLAQLTAPFADDKQIASVAGTLVFSSRPDVVASAGIEMYRNGVALDARLGTTIDDARSASPEPVFGASGGAAAYRVAALRDAGGLCDSFFLYLEDSDLAWRLRLRGWRAVWAPAAVSAHHYSASSIEGSPIKRRLLARNRIWMLARCLPEAAWRRDRTSIGAFDATAILYGLARLDGAALRGRLEGIAALPVRLRERREIQSRATVDPQEVACWLRDPIAPSRLVALRHLTQQLATRSHR